MMRARAAPIKTYRYFLPACHSASKDDARNVCAGDGQDNSDDCHQQTDEGSDRSLFTGKWRKRRGTEFFVTIVCRIFVLKRAADDLHFCSCFFQRNVSFQTTAEEEIRSRTIRIGLQRKPNIRRANTGSNESLVCNTDDGI